MAYVTITFNFRETNGGDEETVDNEFSVDSTLEHDIDNFAQEWIDERNDSPLKDDADVDNAEEWACWVLTGWEFSEWDDDFNAPTDFKSADEYGEYVEKCEKHGQGYRLRYDDVGDHDFDDEYNGCWNSEQEFAQDLFEQCYDIPQNLHCYIDWEHVARDVLMDYSVYEGSEGYHIFRN